MDPNIKEHAMPDYQPDQLKYRLSTMLEEKKRIEQKVVNGEDPLLLIRQNKEVDTYLSSYDSTGAKQGHLLGERLSADLDNRRVTPENMVPTLAPHGLEMDEAGHIIPDQKDSVRHFGMVSVVELTRQNTDGGHDAGNKAMASTVYAIENAIKSALTAHVPVEILKNQSLEDIYEIFHTRGADFAYTLDLGSLPEHARDAVANAIKDEISRVKAKGADNIPGSMLGVVDMKHAEAISLFNELQDRLIQMGHPPIGPDLAKRFTIDLMRRSSEVGLERQHLWLMAQKYRTLLATNPDEASIHFQKYMERKFAGSSMATGETFQPKDPQSDIRDENDEHIDNAIEEKVSEALIRQQSGVDIEESLLLDLVAGYELPPAQEVQLSDEDRQVLAAQRHLDQIFIKSHEATTERASMITTYKAVTYDTKPIIDRLIQNPESINTLNEDEIDLIASLVDFAELPILVNSTNGDIEVMEPINMLINRLGDHTATSADVQRLNYLYEVVLQERALQESRVDQLSGLANRREYMMDMKEALQNGEDVQTLFIDLGFLQYYNTGGRDV